MVAPEIHNIVERVARLVGKGQIVNEKRLLLRYAP
jgi:hypothetical protein